MPPTAVIQVKRGIGDVIWHLPFIRAIAAKEPSGAVAFLTLPSTHAKELLQGEPSVADVVYFGHGGSELQRGLHLARLAALLRRSRFQTVWILDRTIRPALAAKLAGVPRRIGPGDGAQRWFITNRGIDPGHFRGLAMDWLRTFVELMNVPVASTEPDLKLPAALLVAVRARYASTPRPWVAVALGGSHLTKDWPAEHWTVFVDALRRRVEGTVFLVGGPDNAARANGLIARPSGATAINACDLTVAEAAALLRHADLFVGPDSGPMNFAAAGGTTAFALFGSTPVLRYSKFIHAIEPPEGQSPDGMMRISPSDVLARIEPYLAMTK